MANNIKRFIIKEITTSLITGSLFLFGNTSNHGTSSKDTFNGYLKQKFEKRNIKTFNTLENSIESDSSFYSGNIKNKAYEIEPLRDKYAREFQNKKLLTK